MTREDPSDRQAHEQALRWHRLMQQEPGASERAAFDRWLMQSPRHVRSYLLMVALDQELSGLDPQRQLEVEPLTGLADDAPVQLHPSVERESADRSKRPRRVWLMAAAAVAVLAVLGAALTALNPPGRFATQVGEQHIVKLDDGSVMYLNTRSRARVQYTPEARDILLSSGEALFEVAHDAARPFRVHAGGVTIQALGTQFNVHVRDHGIAVAVLEGRVQVLTGEPAVALGAGEEVEIRDGGGVAKSKPADISAAVDWRERRLVFREDALGDIVEEFNRYNEKPRLSVEGAAARERRYSGIFDAYDPSSLAQVLSDDAALEVQRGESRITIRERTPSLPEPVPGR